MWSLCYHSMVCPWAADGRDLTFVSLQTLHYIKILPKGSRSINMRHAVVYVDGVRLSLRTVATNEHIVHPSDDF
jgi:hypothetical protein